MIAKSQQNRIKLVTGPGLGEEVWALRPGNLVATAALVEALADTAAAEAATALAASMNLSRCLFPVADAYQGYLLTWKPAVKY